MLEAMAARAALDQELVLRESFPEEAIVVRDARPQVLHRRFPFVPNDPPPLE